MMSSVFSDLTSEIYQILRSFGDTIIMYDSNGNEIYDASKATRMFTEPSGIMMSFIKSEDNDSSNNEIRMYISNTVDLSDIIKMLTTIRRTSNRFGFILTIKKYGKKITPRDMTNGTILESKLYGSFNKSYQDVGNFKIVIEHNSTIDPDKRGSRSRNIHNIFLENKTTKELYKLPSKSLSSARAFARHLNYDGKYNDGIYKFLENLSNEYTVLKEFNKKASKVDNDFIKKLISNTTKRLNEIKNIFAIVSGSRNYKIYYDKFCDTNYRYDHKINFDDIYKIIPYDGIKNYMMAFNDRETVYPGLYSDMISELQKDIKSLTRYKKLIDYDVLDDHIVFYDSDCFSDVLDICEQFSMNYNLKPLKEVEMDDNKWVSITFPSEKVRDFVLSNIRDDFSYGPEEVKSENENKISFKNDDIKNELEDYINVLTGDNNSSVNNESLTEWVKSYDPNVFLKETKGLTPEDEAIQISPKYFDVHDFSNTLKHRDLWRGNLTQSQQNDAISLLAQYLASEVSEKENIDIHPEKYFDTAKGLYFRIVKPMMTRERISENTISVLEGISVKDFRDTTLDFDAFITETLKTKIKDIDEDSIKNIIKEYRSVLEPIFKSVKEDEKIDDPTNFKIQQNIARKYSGIQPGTRVVTPYGKGTVISKAAIKLKNKNPARTIPGYNVGFDDGHEEFYVERDVKPMNNASDSLKHNGIKNNFGIQNDLTVKDAYMKEDEDIQEVTLEDLASDFVADPEYGVKIKQAFNKTKIIDDEYLEDRVIAYLLKYIDDSNEEDIFDFKNAVSDKFREEGYSLDIDESDDVIGTNYQNSILGDIQSDRVSNPYTHKFGNMDGDQVDQITRLKALAGLSRNS